MQPLYLRLVRNAYFGIRQRCKTGYSLGFCNPAIGGSDDAEPMIGMLAEFFQMVVNQIYAREFQEGDNQTDSVGTFNVAFYLCIQGHSALSSCKEVAGSESCERTDKVVSCGFQTCIFLTRNDGRKHLSVIRHFLF